MLCVIASSKAIDPKKNHSKYCFHCYAPVLAVPGLPLTGFGSFTVFAQTKLFIFCYDDEMWGMGMDKKINI